MLYSMYQYFISFYGQIIFHHVDISHVIYLSASGCLGVFLLFGYYKICPSEHLCTSFCVNMFSFVGVIYVWE